MATYERETWVEAPLEEVWDFHQRVEGLEALTPGWMALRVEATRGPDGEPDPEELVEGAEVEVSVRTAPLGPRVSWRSVILDRSYDPEAGAAMFRDRMEDGPFRTWEHTHAFTAEEGGTRISDRVDYELPTRPLSKVSGVGKPFLAYMFRARHKRSRATFG
jgi:ligand-binding SRPBCC domain-containing protein